MGERRNNLKLLQGHAGELVFIFGLLLDITSHPLTLHVEGAVEVFAYPDFVAGNEFSRNSS